MIFETYKPLYIFIMKKNYILTLIFTILISGFSFGQEILQDFSNFTNTATADVYGGFGG